MNEQINIFLKLLLHSSQRAESVNMTPLCKRLAIDIVGYLGFGYALKTQTELTNRFIIEDMGKAIYMTNLYFTWPSLRYLAPVLRWLGKKKRNTFHAAVQEMIISRMAEPKDAKPDFYSVAAGEHDSENEGLHQSELWNEALFFVSAGGTTVSAAMCGILFHLSRQREVYKQLAAEIRSTFTSGHEIQSGYKLAACKYLRAVIDESIRVSPPSLSTLWREPDSFSSGPFVVDGQVIPPGTQVAVNLWSVLHDPKYFPEPFTFRPERWLFSEEEKTDREGTHTQEDRATMRKAQVMFGIGDRSCAGKAMAYLETSLVLAKVLWYFDFQVAPGETGKLGGGQGRSKYPWKNYDQYQLADILVAEHDGPNLVFQPREDYWKDL
jgi:cytochrome P450